MIRSSRSPPIVCNVKVWNRVKDAPRRRSSSILAPTALTCRSSRLIGFWAALMTWLGLASAEQYHYIKLRRENYALSVLLNCALLTSSLAFPLWAACLTSAPMNSPSRSQSVQMNKALAQRACWAMLSAMALLSCDAFSHIQSQPKQSLLDPQSRQRGHRKVDLGDTSAISDIADRNRGRKDGQWHWSWSQGNRPMVPQKRNWTRNSWHMDYQLRFSTLYISMPPTFPQ